MFNVPKFIPLSSHMITFKKILVTLCCIGFYQHYTFTSRYLVQQLQNLDKIFEKIKLIDCQLFVPKITSHKILEFLKVVDLVGNAHVRILSDASFNFDSFWKHVKRGLNPCCFLLVLVIECTYVLYLTIFFNVLRD